MATKKKPVIKKDHDKLLNKALKPSNLTAEEPKKTLDEQKAEYKANIHAAFDSLFFSLRSIPVALQEMANVYYQLQTAKSWLDDFVDSLTEK